jgi:hypothetical protein
MSVNIAIGLTMQSKLVLNNLPDENNLDLFLGLPNLRRSRRIGMVDLPDGRHIRDQVRRPHLCRSCPRRPDSHLVNILVFSIFIIGFL